MEVTISTSYVLMARYEFVYTSIYKYILTYTTFRWDVQEHILIRSAWMELRLQSTVVALHVRAPRAGVTVLTVSWLMDIAESVIAAGWQR